jgi:hypothetical protein
VAACVSHARPLPEPRRVLRGPRRLDHGRCARRRPASYFPGDARAGQREDRGYPGQVKGLSWRQRPALSGGCGPGR